MVHMYPRRQALAHPLCKEQLNGAVFSLLFFTHGDGGAQLELTDLCLCSGEHPR